MIFQAIMDFLTIYNTLSNTGLIIMICVAASRREG